MDSAKPIIPRLRHSQRGLTLVEIIVVLVVLGLLIVVLTGGVFSAGEKAKAKLNGIKMKQIQSMLGEYQLQYNAFPGSLQGLTGCNEQTGQNCVPIAKTEDLVDAFGTPLQYSSDGRSYTLKSLGADRRDGGSGAEGDMVVTGP